MFEGVLTYHSISLTQELMLADVHEKHDRLKTEKHLDSALDILEEIHTAILRRKESYGTARPRNL